MRPRRAFRRPAVMIPAVLVLSLGACESTAPQPEPTFHAVWAGDPWLGEAWATFGYSGSDTLFVSGSRPVGATQFGSGPFPESLVGVAIAYEGPGTYEIGPGEAHYRYLVGGDVVAATYASTSGTLTIDAVTETVVTGSIAFDAVSTTEHAPAGPEASFVGTFMAQRFALSP